MPRSPRSARRKKKQVEAPPADVDLRVPTPVLIGLTVALAVVYFVLSRLSDGFYQHDEVAHFISMRQFWHDPNVALGNWAGAVEDAFAAFASGIEPGGVLVTCCDDPGARRLAARAAAQAGLRVPDDLAISWDESGRKWVGSYHCNPVRSES